MNTVDEMKNILQAFKEGKPLQVRGITSNWQDSILTLPNLLHWMSLGKDVRIAEQLVAPAQTLPPPTPELTEAMINEALALWKSGVPLQRRSGPTEWVDINRPSLATLMAWTVQFKYFSIRAAPPKPRELWVGEFKSSTGVLSIGSYSYLSKEASDAAHTDVYSYVRSVKFVEVIE